MPDISARYCPLCNQPVLLDESYTSYVLPLTTMRPLVYGPVHDACEVKLI